MTLLCTPYDARPAGSAPVCSDPPRIHRSEDLCPLDRPDTSIPYRCCCLHDGTRTLYELGAIGEAALRDRMLQEPTPEEAIRFAEDLRSAINVLECEHPSFGDRRSSRRLVLRRDSVRLHPEDLTFRAAMLAMHQTADWYACVGQHGFGVRLDVRT